MQGFQLQSNESIFKREMMQVFPSSLACVHARKDQFYLGAVRVTSLSFSSSQCCCLKRAIARSLSESQSHFWGVSGMGTEMLFWRDKYQRQSHCPQGMGQGSGHSWQQQQLSFCPLQPGLISDLLQQCLQPSQARKLPANVRVCKHKQSSKN